MLCKLKIQVSKGDFFIWESWIPGHNNLQLDPVSRYLCIQSEPSLEEDIGDVENVLPGSRPQEEDSIWPQWLSTSCPHISCDEGTGETGPGHSQTTGEIMYYVFYI